MTTKAKKAKAKTTKVKTTKARPAKIDRLHASAEDELLLPESDDVLGARWNRPRKQKISLHVDVEVVDWLKSKGPGYQTRINRILRKAMTAGKRTKSER